MISCFEVKPCVGLWVALSLAGWFGWVLHPSWGARGRPQPTWAPPLWLLSSYLCRLPFKGGAFPWEMLEGSASQDRDATWPAPTSISQLKTTKNKQQYLPDTTCAWCTMALQFFMLTPQWGYWDCAWTTHVLLCCNQSEFNTVLAHILFRFLFQSMQTML